MPDFNTLKLIALLSGLVFLGGCGSDDDDVLFVQDSLDDDLRALLASHGITPLDTGPVPALAMVELGRALMFDKELSGNRDISCATCHHPDFHTGDELSLSIGTGGTGLGPTRMLGAGRPFIPRNAPEVFNRGAPEWTSMFWDSRVSGDAVDGFLTPAGPALPPGLTSVLAAQAMFPVTSREEMRGSVGDLDVFGQPNELAAIPDVDLPGMWDGIMARLLAIPAYVDLFQAAFPGVALGDLGFEHAATAIAAFEADVWTFADTPFDRYLAGDDDAMSQSAKIGALIFYGTAGCVDCHAGNLMTDQDHHDIAAPQIGPGKGAESPEDFGRGRETGLLVDRYKFRTPPLRNVALTGPWFHDGAYVDLELAVRHHLNPEFALRNYDPSVLRPELQSTFQGSPSTLDAILDNLDPLVQPPLALQDQDVADLMDFLTALTDPAALDQSDETPATVPSGLPVD